VWGPLESLYEEGRAAIPQWNAGAAAAPTTEKENLLVLPEGRRR